MSASDGLSVPASRHPHIGRSTDLGAVLQALRLSLGLTQAELAAKAKVTRRWISQVENGKATAEIGVLFRVLSALDSHIEIVHSPSRRPSLDEFVSSFVSEHSP